MTAAEGPRQLEQATAELLGAELRRVIGGDSDGSWFDWWFGELAEAAAAQVQAGAGRGRAWQGPWRMLHGLTSIGPPPLAAIAHTSIGNASREAHKAKHDDALRQEPAWLWKLPMITATDEIWRLRDIYGSRLAVVAEFCYPGGTDPSAFLFDIDACGPVTLASAGAYDDVSQAVAAWRALVGDAASDAQQAAVESADDLSCLVHFAAQEALVGTETRPVTDNWFRARRRVHDLAGMLAKRGLTLPVARSLHDGIDTGPMSAAFVRWHLERHGAEPDSAAVATLAEEWLDGMLPGTEHAVSPHRIAIQLALIGARSEDDPAAAVAKALLPEWVRWHGEQAGLPDRRIIRSVEVAAGDARAATDCPGARI